MMGDEKLLVIWLDDSYCLLKFPSVNSCDAGYQLWEEGRSGSRKRM